MKRSRTTLRDIFGQLMDRGDIHGADVQRIEDHFVAGKQEAPQPWYIRGCAGFAAWLAALFFIAFLFMAEIIDYSEGTGPLIVGLLLCAVAIGINQAKVHSDFAWQGALALCITGQILFVYGLFEFAYDSLMVPILITIALEAVLIVLYNDRLVRFVSTVIIIAMIVVLIYDQYLPNLIPFLSVLLAVMAVLIWENEIALARSSVKHIYQPVGHGITLGMLGVVCLPVVNLLEITLWWVSTVGLLCVLLWVIYRIVTYHNLNLRSSGVMLAFIGTIPLAAIAVQIPGIVGSLAVLLLGFHRGNRVVMGAGGMFLAYFVTLFYYDMELTLLLKSFVLIGSGVLFLLVRYFLLRSLFRHEVDS